MKKLLILICLFPYACLAQSLTDTVSLDEGNFHTAWSHSAKYPVKVYWHLTKAMLTCENKLKRCNCFQLDPQLPGETDLDADYKGSGFDRGHNFDAADDACATEDLNLHCWFFTNMAPQTKHLNEITWKALEDQCRKMALTGDDLFIECGSIGSRKVIGKDSVSVPEFCWKVIQHANGDIEAYLMPNSDDVNQFPYTHYKVDIAVLKQKTGLSL
ncbi:MAG: DNA/RNA non-specific endonuclease [Bacteroidetes bacterium]|jgi:endonuclease G|nr:DNA/RNA non-specific endonuclease [Bacteroidota bacterium]